MGSIGEFTNDVSAGGGTRKSVAGMCASLPSLNHNIIGHDCHFHKSGRPTVYFDAGIFSHATSRCRCEEADTVFGYGITKNQFGFIHAPAPDHDVVVTDSHRPVQIICPFIEQNCATTIVAGFPTGLFEGGRIIDIIVCFTAEFFNSGESFYGGYTPLDAAFSPIGVYETVGPYNICGCKSVFFLRFDFVLAFPWQLCLLTLGV